MMTTVALKGIAVSPGIAIGKVQVLDLEPEVNHVSTVTPIHVDEELIRFGDALREAEEKLLKIMETVQKKSGERDAMIFQAQLSILKDETGKQEVRSSIENDKINAETAVFRLMRSFDTKFQSISDSTRDWASEVRDPWMVVLQCLRQHEETKLLKGKEKVILVTEELTPSLAMYLEKGKVLALVSERGGKYSHGAILARSFGIPAVAKIDKATSKLVSGLQVVVNGDAGTILLDPEDKELANYRKIQKQQSESRQKLLALAAEPAVSRDGARVNIQANIESIRDFETFDLRSVDGVGLLRTEFLFMERQEMPSEEEQVRIYTEALRRMGDRPVTFRTLDVGGDKPLPMLQTPAERNPALGWRGLRLSLEWRDLLIVQLRALLQASEHGKVRILLPMVTNREEVRTVRALLQELREDLIRAGKKIAPDVPLGIMVEVPAAAYLVRYLGKEVDFVSIGTNDLTQYLLAVDRDNPWVATLYEPFHPSILRVVDECLQAAAEQGLEVSVCGEMAGDPLAALLFFAMGIRHLSMAPNFIPRIKALLREADARDLSRLRDDVFNLSASSEIQAHLQSSYERLWKSFTAGQSGPKGRREKAQAEKKT